MNVNGKHYRTIWLNDDGSVRIINQVALPHRFEFLDLCTVEDVRRAIKDMYVRGAGLIGACAAFGMYLAVLEARPASFAQDLAAAARLLKSTRPTASNLAWAVDRMLLSLGVNGDGSVRDEGWVRDSGGVGDKSDTRDTEWLRARACALAQRIADEDADACKRIGEHGLPLIKAIAAGKNGVPVNILTHCNAGWLAFVDYGSALAPVYAAFDSGVAVHVWVDETRPRNQGASLTAWELGQHGVPHDLIADNAGGYLMQHNMVDLMITGADRVTRRGDTANKIGTYLKAIAAKENKVPFYVALPSSTLDFAMDDGVAEIPIEERSGDEVCYITGKTASGAIEAVRICPDNTPARNWGFDVTPARYITGLISERGVCAADATAIAALYSECAKC